MDLIRIIRNKIHFDFRYTCPKTGKRNRCRKATGLENSQENRLKAQQMALAELQALSHSNQSEKQSKKQTQPQSSSSSQKTVKMTITELFEQYKDDDQWFDLEETSKVLYDRWFRVHTQPFFKNKAVQDISLDQVKQFRRHLANSKKTEQNGSKTKYSGKYLNQILSFFCQLLRFAFQEQLIPPFDLSNKNLKKFKEIKPEVNALTPEERDIFLGHVKEHDSFYYPVMYLAAFTGLRRGEIRALKWKEVNLTAKTVQVKYSMAGKDTIKSTKTAKNRTIYLSDELAEILQGLKNKKTKISDFVFLGTDGNHLKEHRLTKVVGRNAERAGLKHISLHSLRHTCASVIANQHGILLASQVLGHSQITTTMGYYHSNEDAIRRAMLNQ